MKRYSMLNFHFPPVDGVPLGHWLRARNDGQLPEIQWPACLINICKDLVLRMICFHKAKRFRISEVQSNLKRIKDATGKVNKDPSQSNSSIMLEVGKNM